jgi:type II secretory pathway pseudopilin PulG
MRTGQHIGRRVNAGFTYIGVMIMIAVVSVAVTGVEEGWHKAHQRDKEQELLFIGDQFRRAIAQFYAHSPGKAPRYPATLEELLKDPRYPVTRRYLRKVYTDPMTGKAEWGLIIGPGGGIVGVHSLSQDAPVKKAHFRLADKAFEGKPKYADWVFMHVS